MPGFVFFKVFAAKKPAEKEVTSPMWLMNESGPTFGQTDLTDFLSLFSTSSKAMWLPTASGAGTLEAANNTPMAKCGIEYRSNGQGLRG